MVLSRSVTTREQSYRPRAQSIEGAKPFLVRAPAEPMRQSRPRPQSARVGSNGRQNGATAGQVSPRLHAWHEAWD